MQACPGIKTPPLAIMLGPPGPARLLHQMANFSAPQETTPELPSTKVPIGPRFAESKCGILVI